MMKMGGGAPPISFVHDHDLRKLQHCHAKCALRILNSQTTPLRPQKVGLLPASDSPRQVEGGEVDSAQADTRFDEEGPADCNMTDQVAKGHSGDQLTSTRRRGLFIWLLAIIVFGIMALVLRSQGQSKEAYGLTAALHPVSISRKLLQTSSTETIAQRREKIFGRRHSKSGGHSSKRQLHGKGISGKQSAHEKYFNRREGLQASSGSGHSYLRVNQLTQED